MLIFAACLRKQNTLGAHYLFQGQFLPSLDMYAMLCCLIELYSFFSFYASA